jgi:CRP/FNR family transcriptional regulator, cyclic AMP receptor protein
MKSLSEHLRATLWANTLTDEQLRRVEADMEEQLCAAGTSVCRKGEAVDAWIGVLEGLVKTAHGIFADGRSADVHRGADGRVVRRGFAAQVRAAGSTVCWRYVKARIASMPRRPLSGSGQQHRVQPLCAAPAERAPGSVHRAGRVSSRLLDTDARVARCLGELFNPILYPGIGPRLSISQEEIGYLTPACRGSA